MLPAKSQSRSGQPDARVVTVHGNELKGVARSGDCLVVISFRGALVDNSLYVWESELGRMIRRIRFTDEGTARLVPPGEGFTIEIDPEENSRGWRCVGRLNQVLKSM